ncbi:MAG: hypothetical protein ACE5FA_01080 [Dehalococcoidia bacterium]
MRRIFTFLVSLCALALLGQSAGTGLTAGISLTGVTTSTPSIQPVRVIDLAYLSLQSGGIVESHAPVQGGGLWPPAPWFDDTFSAISEFGVRNQYVNDLPISMSSYDVGTDATGPRFFNASTDLPELEKFVCRKKSAVLSTGLVSTGSTATTLVSQTAQWAGGDDQAGNYIQDVTTGQMLKVATNTTTVATLDPLHSWTNNGGVIPSNGDTWEMYEDPVPCSTGATCLANVLWNEGGGNKKRFEVVFEDTRVTPPRYHLASLRYSKSCTSVAHDVGLATLLTIPDGANATGIRVEPMMWNNGHFTPSWFKLAAQWIRELPKAMTIFPPDGGMAIHGNVNTFTVTSDQGSWGQEASNGSFFSPTFAASVAVPDINGSLHGQSLYWIPSQGANSRVILGPFQNVEDQNPGGTDTDRDNYYVAHGIVGCGDVKAEIWVANESTSTDYTLAGAGQTSPLSTNYYRVYYYDYDQGWVTPPVFGGNGHPLLPRCSSDAGLPVGGGFHRVIVAVGVDESASAQEFSVSFNPRDNNENDSQFRRIYVDEWYVHRKEDPTLDLVLAFPSPLNANLIGDSNFKENLWATTPNECTTFTMNASRRCGHLMWAMQEIGPLPIGDHSYNRKTVATAGFELCNQFEVGGTEFSGLGGSVNTDYGFSGSLLDAILSNPAVTPAPFVFMALGQNDDGKPSVLSQCYDRVRSRIQLVGSTPVFVTHPHFQGSTNNTAKAAEAGGTEVFDLWWDEFMVQMIDSGAFYKFLPAGMSSQ